MPTWSAEHLGRDRHVVKVQFDGAGDTFEVFLSSDWHWDHPDCQRKLLKRDLDEAKRLNAPIFGFGDNLCLMQMPRDFRATKGKTRAGHDREDYLDAVTDDFADWLEPYKEQLVLLSQGNHETSHVRMGGIDVLRHTADKLKARGAPHVDTGSYTGYVRFAFERCNQRERVDLFYHHGFGRGAPVSRGTQKINHRTMMADADIYYDGHDHWRWPFPLMTQRLNQQGVIVPRKILHVHGGAYKSPLESDKPAHYSWEVEKMGGGLRPLGGWFVRFWLEGKDQGRRVAFGVRDPMPERAAA